MANCRCNSVKGYRTNKSTAFSPDGAKFGTQSLIHNHMMSHYRLIENAKSAIDNKPPKSMAKFIKVHSSRVQERKEKERKAYNELRRSQTSTPLHQIEKNKPHSDSIDFRYDDEADWIENEYLSNQKQTALRESQVDPSSYVESFTKPRSKHAFSYKSPANINVEKSQTPKYKIEMFEPDKEPTHIEGSLFRKSSVINNVTKKEDILKMHPNDNAVNVEDVKFTPKNAWGNYTRHSQNEKSYSVTWNEEIENILDPNYGWSSGIVSYKHSDFNNSVRLDFSTMSLNEQLNHARSVRKFESKHLPVYEVNRLQKQEELIAEEQLYLQFVEEITTDILTRGIFTDRVLNQVFDCHIERRKGQLDEGRMRAAVEELKEDLNVKETTDLLLAPRSKPVKEKKKSKKEKTKKSKSTGHTEFNETVMTESTENINPILQNDFSNAPLLNTPEIPEVEEEQKDINVGTHTLNESVLLEENEADEYEYSQKINPTDLSDPENYFNDSSTYRKEDGACGYEDEFIGISRAKETNSVTDAQESDNLFEKNNGKNELTNFEITSSTTKELLQSEDLHVPTEVLGNEEFEGPNAGTFEDSDGEF